MNKLIKAEYIINSFHFFGLAVPGSPSNIKALPVDRNSIMISWLPPEEPNGEILGYSLYMKTMERGRQFTQDFPLASHVHYYTMGGLNQVKLISNHGKTLFAVD